MATQPLSSPSTTVPALSQSPRDRFSVLMHVMQLRLSKARDLYLPAHQTPPKRCTLRAGQGRGALVDEVAPVVRLQREEAVRARGQRHAAVAARRASEK